MYLLSTFQLRVTQVVPMWMNSSELGTQIGRAKSENTTGLSVFRITTDTPSTGDLTMPTIRRFCSHGASLFSLTLANLAVHLALPCLLDILIVSQ